MKVLPKNRRKKNCRPSHPLTLPSPPSGEGTDDSSFFADPNRPLARLACSSQTRGDRRSPLVRSGSERKGFTLLEIIVSLILLGTAMTIIVPTLGWMGVQNRLSLQKQEAVQGLHNLMEELTMRPYEELTPEAAGKIELPAALQSQLPGAKLEVDITERDSKPPAKRIRMRLTWNQRNGTSLSPLRLSAWVHERGTP